MNDTERERYQTALRRAAVAKGFDRLLHIVSILAFLLTASYVVYQQAAYQARTSVVSEERNKQLNEIAASQKSIQRAADSIKTHDDCLKLLPDPATKEQIKQCWKQP